MWDFEKFTSDTALIAEDGKTVTYSEMIGAGEEIFGAIGRRCLVFSLCRNEIGSIIGYTAFLQNRVVPLLLSASIDKELLLNLLELYKPAYVWLPKDMEEDVPGLLKDANYSSGESHSTGGNHSDDARSVISVYDYSLVRTNYDSEFDLYDELCLLLTTSGSTGSPKLVRQSYTNVFANAESIAEYLELTRDERPITTLPMNYTYGLSIINSHFLVGAAILVTEKTLMQKDFWSFFKESGATSFGGVPYTYEMLDKLRFFRMDLPSLRYMTQAGGKLTVELHKKCADYAEATGRKFIVMYGQCEATARMGYLPGDKALLKIGSMGIAIPGGKFTLVDENENTIIEPDTPGELIYEGKNVTLGYAEKGEDLSLGDERGGILHTGDMAKFDADGYYYIVGRKKRFLKIYGNRVNLDEVERLIKGHFEGLEVACSGTDDHLYIYVTEDRGNLDEIINFVALKTGLNKAAFKTVVIDEIPKNDSGKVQYNKLLSNLN